MPALPRDHMDEFLATQPPWETLCCTCGANADPEAKIKRAPSKKGKGSKKAAAAAAAAAVAAAAAATAEADDVIWPALRCFICRRPRHVECLTLPGQARVSAYIFFLYVYKYVYVSGAVLPERKYSKSFIIQRRK